MAGLRATEVTGSGSDSSVAHLCRYAVILAFDIRVEREAQEYADSVGVRIFSADIIYHLFDRFLDYREVSCVFSVCMLSLTTVFTQESPPGAIPVSLLPRVRPWCQWDPALGSSFECARPSVTHLG